MNQKTRFLRARILGPCALAAAFLGCAASAPPAAHEPTPPSLGAGGGPTAAAPATAEDKGATATATPPADQPLDKLVAEWPARPRGAVLEMTGKYGKPAEMSSESIVWHNAGVYKRIRNEVSTHLDLAKKLQGAP